MSGSCRELYAIHQVARAMRQQIHIAIAACATGRISPKAGEETENIRKIIRPGTAAEQPLDELGVVPNRAERLGNVSTVDCSLDVTNSPFTIGLIQDHATEDVAANVARAERLVREAARRGAPIIFLKTLFKAERENSTPH